MVINRVMILFSGCFFDCLVYFQMEDSKCDLER